MGATAVADPKPEIPPEYEYQYVVAPTTARVDVAYGPYSIAQAKKKQKELGRDWRVLRLMLG